MRTMLVVVVAALVPTLQGGIVYENDYTNFSSAIAGLTQGKINWDDVALNGGEYTTILGDRYNGLFGSPSLSVDNNSGMYVGDPGAGWFDADFVAFSADNVFALDPETVTVGPEGILTITFDRPMYYFGAWFLDVEGDYANTGLYINGQLHAFSANQGDNAQSFLGVFDAGGFTSVDIYMSVQPGHNGVGLDDIIWAVPAPHASVLAVLGISALVAMRRRAV